jgi:four helix bundle protein
MDKPHKKLEAWRQSIRLTIAIYQATDTVPKEHRYVLTDQVRLAALSVASNIAEGAARQTKKEFANYLHTAQASLSELDTQLEIAKQLGLLADDRSSDLDTKMNHIDKMLSCLIRNVKNGRPSPIALHSSPLTPHR